MAHNMGLKQTSKTFRTPSFVKAEHSIYRIAPILFAICCPSSYLTGALTIFIIYMIKMTDLGGLTVKT